MRNPLKIEELPNGVTHDENLLQIPEVNFRLQKHGFE